MSASPRRPTKHPGPFANPFYLLLVVAGALFFVTAFAYGAMAVRQLHAGPVVAEAGSDGSFVQLLDRHGISTMFVELIVLSVATVMAMATDGYWSRAVAPDDSDHSAGQQGSST
jgi:hypothetical protein